MHLKTESERPKSANVPKLTCGIIILFLEEATLGKLHGEGRKTEMAPNSCSDSATDELHDLGQVLPLQTSFFSSVKGPVGLDDCYSPF